MTQIYTFDANIVSDLHKDAHGYRPREWFWAEWHAADDAGKQRIWDVLIDELHEENIRIERGEQAAIAATEVRIAEILNLVIGSTREDAIRFLDEAHDCGGDRSYLEFCLGVPYGYLGGKLFGALSQPQRV